MLNFVGLFVFGTVLITSQSASLDTGDTDANSELYLTPFIETGRIDAGRYLAKVKPFLGDIESYSGLLTVDKNYDSNMFFWYFPSERKASEVPLLVWLNGWSTASTYGVFLQTGPYDKLTSELKLRETSWQKYYNVLYIDNPVGVGYSFTNSTEGYSTDLDKVSLNLASALEQFLQLFPDLSGRELYLTGLSLAGKYISALAHHIYKIDSLNLKGIFLGNPLLDLAIQANYVDYLYRLGFVDKNQVAEMMVQQDLYNEVVRGNDSERFLKFSYYFWASSKSYLINITGLDNIFDYEDFVLDDQHYIQFVTRDDVRRALHVPRLNFNNGTTAMNLFAKGFTFSVLGYLGEMAESVKMMFYAGQRDVSCAYPMMIDALTSIEWSGKEEYAATKRQFLYEEDGHHVWGYKRSHKTISDVMVRKAGHSAVTGQPKHVLSLLHNITDYHRFD